MIVCGAAAMRACAACAAAEIIFMPLSLSPEPLFHEARRECNGGGDCRGAGAAEEEEEEGSSEVELPLLLIRTGGSLLPPLPYCWSGNDENDEDEVNVAPLWCIPGGGDVDLELAPDVTAAEEGRPYMFALPTIAACCCCCCCACVKAARVD